MWSRLLVNNNMDETRKISPEESARRIANLELLIQSQESARDFAQKIIDAGPDKYLADCEDTIAELETEITKWKLRALRWVV